MIHLVLESVDGIWTGLHWEHRGGDRDGQPATQIEAMRDGFAVPKEWAPVTVFAIECLILKAMQQAEREAK